MTVARDASAALALLTDARGGKAVAHVADAAVIGAVNLAAARQRRERRAVEPAAIAAAHALFRDRVMPVAGARARDAGGLRAATRARGLSRDVPAVTADRAWSARDAGVRMEGTR